MIEQGATVVQIAEPASAAAKDSRAEQMEKHATLLFAAMQNQYRLLLDDKGVSTLATVVEPGVLKVVSKEVAIEQTLIRALGSRATVSDIRNEIYPRWVSEMRLRSALDFKAVKPFHFKSDKNAGWAWQRLTWDPDPNAPIPETYASICTRTSKEEARSLTLYLGSLFDYSFPREQYLYLHGSGGDGKSRIIEAGEKMFAVQGYTTMGADDLGDSHSTSCLEGVRLLTFPDIKKPSLPSTGIFKQLTGDDTMGVNPKGQPRRNIKLDCKVIISSNNEPKLDGGHADLRRLIYVRLAKHEGGEDHSFKERCKEQASEWAKYCYAQYLEWRKDNPTRGLPAADEAMEVVKADSVEGHAQSLIDQHFSFGANLKVPAHVLQGYVKRLANGDYPLEQTVYTLLKRVPNVKKRRQPTEESETRAPAWYGVKLNSDANPLD